MNVGVKVKPGSKAPGMSVDGDSLVLRVRERAAEGAANDACIRALALAAGVPPSRVRLLHGAQSRSKVFCIEGVDESAARKRLGLGVS